MRVDEIQIHTGDPGVPYREIGPVTAKATAATLFSKSPTMEDVNFRLQEEALKRGANAVVNVEYNRGVTATSWKGLTAKGVAVVLESAEVPCPFCAEPIKRQAIKCKHCGSDLSPATSG